MNQTFIELKPKIVAAIEQKFKNSQPAFMGEIGGFTLVEGFMMQGIQDQIQGIILGGKSIPVVAVVGNSTGKIYYFALKALLPEVEI